MVSKNIIREIIPRDRQRYCMAAPGVLPESDGSFAGFPKEPGNE